MYQSLLWGIPFAGVLLSIAFVPLFCAKLWHRHQGAIMAFWVGLWAWASLYVLGVSGTSLVLKETFFHHYLPFLSLIGALFVISGGIHISIKSRGSTLGNAGILAVGALLANLIGTTGASMLLIRPLMRINAFRQRKSHLIVFFIFLVSNVGGCLTPLGDPPLFLGFLEGVPFVWTLMHLWPQFLFVVGGVLLIFCGVDAWLFRHDRRALRAQPLTDERFRILGLKNFLWLFAVLLIVVISGLWSDEPHWWGVSLVDLARDLLLMAVAWLSFRTTPKKIHVANHFSFAPLREVAILFVAIFITMVPVIGLLHAGESGPLGGLESWMNPGGLPNPFKYFWVTGVLSSFLDNAPTYLVFFHMAGGDVLQLTKDWGNVLEAISCGAVFMGAMTYIGNAPNFMVKSMAEESKIKMPSFLGYILWSTFVLLPLFALLGWWRWG